MASTYTMVAYGSQGDTVRQLQSELNRHGYQLDEDGVFGKKTRAAVRDYQKKNSLRLDGIAGDETWGSLLASPAPAEETTPAPVARPSAKTAEALARLEKGYAPSEDVTAAQAYRDSVAALRPDAYDSAYRQRLAALYDEIKGRQAFSYDPETDSAFAQYARLYRQKGRAAMEDTMGQAAQLTGGYGSSYAQSAGQQSYQQYLAKLSDVLPQLQSAAYSRYRDAGDALLERYQLLQGQQEAEYDRWQDEVAAWQKEVAQAQSGYDQISSRDLKNYQMLLNYFADKAAAEQKGMQTSATVPDAVSSIGNTAALSSTAADSLERAMGNYLKSGNVQQADTLLGQYKSRMTPAQRARFEALFAAWNHPVSW